jgi:glutamate dehydrogenase/leucine dehydrogenase
VVAKRLKVTPGLKDKTFIVQGFGNVGYWASKYFTEEGLKLVGVAEYDGSIYNPEGLDVEEVKNYITQNKGLKGFPKAEFLENEEVIYLPWYLCVNQAISSSLQLSKCLSTNTTLTASNVRSSWRPPTDPPQLKVRRYALRKVLDSCQTFS